MKMSLSLRVSASLRYSAFEVAEGRIEFIGI